MNKKIILSAYLLLVAVSAICFLVKLDHIRNKPASATIPSMKISVNNLNNAFDATLGQDNPYKLDFMLIKNVSFATEGKDLFIRYDLGGKLPEQYVLPKIDGDQLTEITFKMTLDDNYFDGNGNKNEGGPEATLKMSFYHNGPIDHDSSKIEYTGELVGGVPGYDFFITKFNYRQLLLNQTGDSVVFTADSLAVSRDFQAGASANVFKNSNLMPDKDPSEIQINLEPAV